MQHREIIEKSTRERLNVDMMFFGKTIFTNYALLVLRGRLYTRCYHRRDRFSDNRGDGCSNGCTD